MPIAAFDTLEFVESLKASGFNDEQARGMALAVKKVQEAHLDELATKGDLREFEARITGQLTLVKWMLALVIAVTVIPALKTLFGL